MTSQELLSNLTADVQEALDLGGENLEHRLKTILLAYVIDLYDHGFSPFKLNVGMALSHTKNEEGYPVIRIEIIPYDERSKDWIAKNTKDLTI